jgi:hypothetical protein
MPRKFEVTVPERADAIEKYLEDCDKPQTLVQILDHFGLNRSSLARAFRLLQNPTHKRIYIKDYCKPPGRDNTNWVAMFAAGSLPDAPWPERSAEEIREKRREQSRRAELRKQEALRAAKEAGTHVDNRRRKPPVTPTLDPFSAALFGRK